MTQAWDVIGRYRIENNRFYGTRHERVLDTVFVDSRDTATEVWRSLVDHDGYPQDIRVECRSLGASEYGD